MGEILLIKLLTPKYFNLIELSSCVSCVHGCFLILCEKKLTVLL